WSLRSRRDTRLVTLLPIIEAGLSPELTGGLNGIDTGRLPPSLLLTRAVNRAGMWGGERHGGFCAHLTTARAPVEITKVMWIGLFPAAHQAGLLGNKAEVLPATTAPRCCDCELALVDAVFRCAYLLRLGNINEDRWSGVACGLRGFRRWELR